MGLQVDTMKKQGGGYNAQAMGKLENDTEGGTHAKVNTEEQPSLAGHFNIRSIPTLMVFREKVMLFSQAGALPASGFSDLIKQVQDLDMDEVRAQIAEGQAKQES